jgi:hypothetical protein
MTDQQRRTIALEYLQRLDSRSTFFELFDDQAQVYFPKWGLATGRIEYEWLFSDLGKMTAEFRHDHAYSTLSSRRMLLSSKERAQM